MKKIFLVVFAIFGFSGCTQGFYDYMYQVNNMQQQQNDSVEYVDSDVAQQMKYEANLRQFRTYRAYEAIERLKDEFPDFEDQLAGAVGVIAFDWGSDEAGDNDKFASGVLLNFASGENTYIDATQKEIGNDMRLDWFRSITLITEYQVIKDIQDDIYRIKYNKDSEEKRVKYINYIVADEGSVRSDFVSLETLGVEQNIRLNFYKHNTPRAKYRGTIYESNPYDKAHYDNRSDYGPDFDQNGIYRGYKNSNKSSW